MTPVEFNAIVFSDIGAEHHSIITALNLLLEPVSFDELHSQLLAHEVLLKSAHEPPLANLSHRRPFFITSPTSSFSPWPWQFSPSNGSTLPYQAWLPASPRLS